MSTSSLSRHIVITGASSGIGRALALEYAGPNRHLFLAARSSGRLNETVRECENRGAKVSSTLVDMRNQEFVTDWLNSCASTAPLDLVIACAGVSASSRSKNGKKIHETLADTLRVMETNAVATMHLAALAADAMLPHKQGQIVLISSIASYYGLPSSPAYCASKAAIRIYGQSLRHLLRPQGIRVNVICPGYVDTPMSQRLKGAQPLRWTAFHAARRIVRALEKDTPEYAFPWPLVIGLKALHFLPDRLAHFFLAGFAFDVEPDQESPLASKDS